MQKNRYATWQALFTSMATLLLCLLLIGCDVKIDSNSVRTQTQSQSTPCSANCTPVTGTHELQLFIEPDAGATVITDAIGNAHKSVWLEIYLLTQRGVIQALKDAAHRGVDVRVMLETHPYGGGNISPTETMQSLQTAGVKTKATSPDFALTHEKGMIIDGTTAYIATANFTQSALGGSSSTKNREYGLIDTNAQDVQSMIAIFNADWDRKDVQLNNPNLVVSPINARASFVSLISSAKTTLQIEAEEMQDNQVEQELSKAAQRGVQVQVILPKSQGSDDSNNGGINDIKRGGVQVKRDTKLYMHAKIIVVDGTKAFVGSENISTASLNRNREVGLIVGNMDVIKKLQETFQQDWGASKAA